MKTKYGMGTLYQRAETWWVQFWKGGRRYRESTKTEDFTEAQRFLKRRLAEVATGQFTGLTPERVRVKELLEIHYREACQKGLRGVYETRMRTNKHLVPAFGHRRVADLNSEDIRLYIKKRQNAEAAVATINRELAIIRHALEIGREATPQLVVNPLRIPLLNESNTRHGFLEDDAYVRLRNELPDYLRPLFVVAYHVGCRKGELTAIKWEQVDFIANCIRVLKTKNGQPRVIPIYGEMAGWLTMAKSDRDFNFPDCPWVFASAGERIVSFRKAWASACNRAEVSGLLFHDLRRSAIRNMERAGIPRSVAMAISGHKTESVYRRYAIVSERDLREAGIRMANFVETVTKTATKFGGARKESDAVN